MKLWAWVSKALILVLSSTYSKDQTALQSYILLVSIALLHLHAIMNLIPPGLPQGLVYSN